MDRFGEDRNVRRSPSDTLEISASSYNAYESQSSDGRLKATALIAAFNIQERCLSRGKAMTATRSLHQLIAKPSNTPLRSGNGSPSLYVCVKNLVSWQKASLPTKNALHHLLLE
jgi:hypothetical protein